MNIKKDVRIGFGVITNQIDAFSPYLDFIENALKNGWRISAFIITYSRTYEQKVVKKLREFTDVQLVKTAGDPELESKLEEIGLSEKSRRTFLHHHDGIIPYGKRRNVVLIKALLAEPELDYLFFVDTDVKPFILNNKGHTEEIDFIGRHLKHLIKEDVVLTTSDYSGYYIIPPLDFRGLRDLLIGLQKEKAYPFLLKNPDTLIAAEKDSANVRETDKILGGNHALKISRTSHLYPYFSTVYRFNNRWRLGRGEDTLLGRQIPLTGKKIIDIDTRIFHDTFGSFPCKPDIFHSKIQERFYNACLGWLGRNPFLNWYLKESGLIDSQEFKERREKQRTHLTAGSRKMASYLNNDRFLKLPRAFEAAYRQLERMKQDYYRTMEVWDELTRKLKIRGKRDEDTSGQSFSFRRLG